MTNDIEHKYNRMTKEELKEVMAYFCITCKEKIKEKQPYQGLGTGYLAKHESSTISPFFSGIVKRRERIDKGEK